VSLIFSALSEMEKQAQDGQAGRAAMPAMHALSSDRKQWPILVGALVVLGVGAFIAVKVFTPSSVVEAPVAPAPTAIAIQQVAPATGSSVSTSAKAATSDTDASLAPYMQAAPEVSTSGAMPVTYSDAGSASPPTATVASAAPLYAPAQTPSLPDGSTAQAVVNSEPSTTSNSASITSSNEVATAPAESEPAPAPQAPPAPRTPPDKSYLDKTTFKLGRQADSSKDQDVSHWVNLFSSEMSAGNYEQARSHLGKLQSKLPAQSITLLRMQAWYAVDTSDDDSARGLFLRILDRVPDDQNAGVNVALIDWRAKRYSAALARIDRLHQLYPDSSLVSQNWRSMHDQRQ